LPLVYSWKAQPNGTRVLTLERTRGAPSATMAFSDEELKAQVAKTQALYKAQQPVLQTALAAFNLHITFLLPGDIVECQVFTQKDRGVSLTLDGKKIMAAMDKFMADDGAIAATIKSGKDLSENDDYLLDAMYGKKGPVSATVKLPADAVGAFNYGMESRAAAAAQHDMLEAAGVVLLPKFIVKPPPVATQPRGR
jgi:hypothetical protein